jgi:hypothetical protein
MSEQFDTEWLAEWQRVANADSTLRVIGKKLTVRFLLEIGERAYVVDMNAGCVEAIATLEELGIDAWWTFAIRGEAEAWSKYVRATPPPLFTDVVFMSFHGNVAIEGDTLVFWQHCRALLWLLDLMRVADAAVPA